MYEEHNTLFLNFVREAFISAIHDKSIYSDLSIIFDLDEDRVTCHKNGSTTYVHIGRVANECFLIDCGSNISSASMYTIRISIRDGMATSTIQNGGKLLWDQQPLKLRTHLYENGVSNIIREYVVDMIKHNVKSAVKTRKAIEAIYRRQNDK